ncbi:MAG: hypothetical protein FD143_24 [Ignavibacteria bacterium]|nr:MAG: hypothetical protein FD143_24 [Ignavibacteria bacterium]KAF0158335.1 MAG: hypothetical protein FD188_2593 [Ignavibacteria bacterium]
MVDRETAINTAKLFVKECGLYGLKFYKVFLFGSYAKNNSHEWSDIDLLLISDQFTENIFDNLKLFSKINIRFPIIEAHPYSTSYYLSGDDFLNKIEKESILIE